MQRSIAVIAIVLVGVGSLALAQQETPIISGGAGFISTTSGGQNFFQPVVAPVVVAPLGSKLLVESRFDIREFIFRQGGSGSYDGQFFTSVEYLQLDIQASPRMTISLGRYLTPFGVYNERQTAIWIRKLEDAPIIFPIGTRTTGSSDGVMLRGAAIAHADWELNYTAYFSALSNANQFESGRAAGGRAGVFFTKPRLEIGASYQRFLQNTHYNASGVYFAWQPPQAPINIKSEYAHGPTGQGYWLEGAFRLVKGPANSTWASRLEPVLRMQQFWRSQPVLTGGDFLPTTDTNRFDGGLNYYLPKEFRLNASYGRQFETGNNRNVWNVAITYRFLFPMFPRRTR